MEEQRIKKKTRLISLIGSLWEMGVFPSIIIIHFFYDSDHGVPQGTVCGPFIFSLYMNPLFNLISITCITINTDNSNASSTSLLLK